MNTTPAKDQLFETAAEPMGGYEFSSSACEPFDQRRDYFGSLAPEASSRRNIGLAEQKVRLAVGTGFLLAAAFAPASRGWKLGFAAMGISQIAMGATRFCPLWHALGVDTRAPDER